MFINDAVPSVSCHNDITEAVYSRRNSSQGAEFRTSINTVSIRSLDVTVFTK